MADSGVTRSRVVVTGNKLPEPVSHPSVGVGVVTYARSHHGKHKEDPNDGTHG